MLSVIIITYNEEDWIINCIRSVGGVADEVIVVDAGSADETVAICKRLGAKVFHHDWQGFSSQKNYALSKSTNEWLLFIDADERISKGLKEEIKKTLNDPKCSGYAFPRQNIFLGELMRHGGWWPDYVTRLARRDKIIGWEKDLHEELKIDGKVGKLKQPIYHLSHRGITWMLNKSIGYTPTEAKLRFDSKHPPMATWRFFRVMLTELWYRLIVKAGWRDGQVGWIEAIYQTFNIFVIYVHLWEMQKKRSMEQIYKNIDDELAKNGF